MIYFLLLNLVLKCFYTGKILSVRFLLTAPCIYIYLLGPFLSEPPDKVFSPFRSTQHLERMMEQQRPIRPSFHFSTAPKDSICSGLWSPGISSLPFLVYLFNYVPTDGEKFEKSCRDLLQYNLHSPQASRHTHTYAASALQTHQWVGLQVPAVTILPPASPLGLFLYRPDPVLSHLASCSDFTCQPFFFLPPERFSLFKPYVERNI